MPLCSVNLVSLSSTTTLPEYLKKLASGLSQPPLVLSHVIRWMIRPTSTDVSLLLDHPWDLLVILPDQDGLPSSLRSPSLVSQLYTVTAGISSAIVKNFGQTNAKLLRPAASDIPPLTGALKKPRIAKDTQNLEMSPDLAEWFPGWESNGRPAGRGAVSMLNLLAFNEGMHAEYLKYGKAFGESIGKKRGGVAKIVGRVVPNKGEQQKWDEIALAHYPSIRHFADMAASEDYQEVNHRHRLKSLKDTCILMTSELDLPSVGGLMARL